MRQPKAVLAVVVLSFAGTEAVACQGRVDVGAVADAGGAPGTGTGSASGSGSGTSPAAGSSGTSSSGPGPSSGASSGVANSSGSNGSSGVANSSSTGSSGSSSGPPDACAPLLAANEELIDNMEGTSEPYIPMINGRSGMWSDWDDGTPGSTMFPAPGTLFQVSDSGDPCHGRVARVYGGPFDTTGAYLAVSLGGPYNASAYIGISFWAISKTPTTLTVQFPDKDTDPSGGICSENVTAANSCYDHFSAPVQIGTTWTKEYISFDTLTQGGWGNVAPQFDPSTLFGLQFELVNDSVFDVSIDELALITQ